MLIDLRKNVESKNFLVCRLKVKVECMNLGCILSIWALYAYRLVADVISEGCIRKRKA